MKLKTRDLVIAAGCAAAIAIPALAYGQDPPSTDTVTAQDAGVNDGKWDKPDVTIVTGGTVTFNDPGTTSAHNVVFTYAQPSSCTQTSGVNAGDPPPLPAFAMKTWSGSCKFNTPGDYPFVCSVHADMTGTIHVKAAATPTPTPGGTSTPGATPTPTPGPGGGGSPGGGSGSSSSKLQLSLKKTQTGTRVRGNVMVEKAGSKLEVSVWAARRTVAGGKSTKLVRIGAMTRSKAPAGKVSFAVATNAKARSALRRHRRLSVTVSIALTPPGGHKLTRSVHSTLRAS